MLLQDLFKSFARYLSHLLTEGKSCEKNEGNQSIVVIYVYV